MVAGECDKVMRSGGFIFLHEGFRVKLFGFPGGDHVFIAHFGGMPVVLQVPLIGLRTLLVHLIGIAVIDPRHRRRPPVRPDAEFGVAKPVRRLILLERRHCRLKRPGVRRGGRRSSGASRPCRDGEAGGNGRAFLQKCASRKCHDKFPLNRSLILHRRQPQAADAGAAFPIPFFVLELKGRTARRQINRAEFHGFPLCRSISRRESESNTETQNWYEPVDFSAGPLRRRHPASA